MLLGHVAADRETVDNTAVQGDLVRVADLDQDLLRLVALLGGEDAVRLSGGDGERASDGGQLILVDKGWVGKEADLDAVLVVASNVLNRGSGQQ